MYRNIKTQLVDRAVDIPEINPNEEAFIFVYGTLLKGRANYSYFLAPEDPIMRGEIEGFVMYEIGSFPGIVKGEGRVKGELYKVDMELLSRIDRLEGEGSLYRRERVTVKGYDIEEVEAYVYVYNHDVSKLDVIPYEAQPYKNDYIWYVSYGSNMCFERFATYIEGGFYERNGREYPACEDTALPTESVELEIMGNMYFANFNQGSWENSAVSFFDKDTFGSTTCRAYLIKKNQLEHIHRNEGKGPNWYPDILDLDDIQGIKAVTFTNNHVKQYAPFSEVSFAYMSTIIDGIMEMGHSADYAYEYVMSCSASTPEVCWIRE